MIPLFPVVVALVVPTSEPIIRRADRPDSAYCQLAAHAKALVSIGRAGDGTLVGPKWVLTAGHVANAVSSRQPERRTVDIAGVTYRVTAAFVHPDWTEMGPHDIGLLRLERA
ncbi:MAG: trypsin-like serine protease, partial [Gemmatimonadales bacterium]